MFEAFKFYNRYLKCYKHSVTYIPPLIHQFFYLLSTFQLSLFFLNYPLQLKKYTFLSEISCLTFLFDLLLEGQRPKAKQDPI